MSPQIGLQLLYGAETLTLVMELPNTCPICKRDINADGQVHQAVRLFDWAEIVLRCPNRQCSRTFIAQYFKTGNNAYSLNKVVPANPDVPAFDEAVAKLSPDFVRIYGQAAAAESHGLDDVAGPGFRKALEFLLKDYAITLAAPDSNEIKKAQLAQVIKKYFTEQKMSVVCSRAAWLGNDETHYEKRWVGKDSADLKKLIAASAHFIAMERLAAELPTEMPG